MKYVSTAGRQRSLLCRPSRASVRRRLCTARDATRHPHAPCLSRDTCQGRPASPPVARKSARAITSRSEGFRLLPGLTAVFCRAMCVARAQDRAQSADGYWVSHAQVGRECVRWRQHVTSNRCHPHGRSLRTAPLHQRRSSPTRGTHLVGQQLAGQHLSTGAEVRWTLTSSR